MSSSSPSTATETAQAAAERDTVLGWRAERLQSLGVDGLVALQLAHLVDWHDVAALVQRGCPPELAVQIVL